MVGGRRGVEIGPAGGGDIDFGSRGGGRTLGFRRGEGGGDRAQKFMKKGPKKELF